MQPLNPTYTRTFPPPVMEARRWIAGKAFPDDRPLINLSQAAPVDPPPEPLARAMARALIEDPAAHLYGPVLGLPELRAELAAQWSAGYGGEITDTQVAITAGCNQAFTAIMSTLAGAGDEVILPLPTGDSLIPEADAAERLITDRTRAIVLITPNNPSGAEYPAATLRAFFELARRKGLALIIDETYRDFHSRDGAPHDLFADPGWDDTLIHL
jgi:aspartate/methionine/tyrosine aminotransferase